MLDIAAHMLGAVLLANSAPHLMHGICGYPFPTPFAKPRFVGLSRPHVNLLWGGAHLAAGVALLFAVGDFTPAADPETALVVGIGFVAALAIGHSIERARARRAPVDQPTGARL